VIRVVIAFATARHARDAVRFLAEASLVLDPPYVRGGEGAEFATVELEVEAGDRERLGTLVHGLHGIVVGERFAEALA
jgi:hypothetical protein